MNITTLFACDWQPIVIEGLKRVLEGLEEFRLLGAAMVPAEALAQISELKPQIVLLDQAGGSKAVFRLLSAIRAEAPHSSPVLWVADLAEVECFRALQLGARGILKKTLPVASLVECLRAVASGNIWMENSLLDSGASPFTRRQIPRLTPRERDIVSCLCRGMRNKEIAAELAITPGTVKVHLMHIFEKTGVKDRFELAIHGRKLLGLDSDTPKHSIHQTENPARADHS
ncbi:MAG: response regulator transcription factor [Bryobacteraceae bacterium]|nr:response regulator transcription factor [Bryobacteraceae bacterium]MDW8378552.1 response regulator transcription factor [Bryobacterales bacterium]